MQIVVIRIFYTLDQDVFKKAKKENKKHLAHHGHHRTL